ncbi:hypothetical protein G6F65_014673 [Rhizopus arrhizus]|nr:hypothetical protein G6F68_010988 [Rhizopus microsporus]KAG1262451.1 hypothetical protein G6F65_014673 [Rhizopus arrhizus]
MVKQKRAFAYHFVSVKSLSLKTEFFILPCGGHFGVSQKVHARCTLAAHGVAYRRPTSLSPHDREPADPAFHAVSHAARQLPVRTAGCGRAAGPGQRPPAAPVLAGRPLPVVRNGVQGRGRAGTGQPLRIAGGALPCRLRPTGIQAVTVACLEAAGGRAGVRALMGAHSTPGLARHTAKLSAEANEIQAR